MGTIKTLIPYIVGGVITYLAGLAVHLTKERVKARAEAAFSNKERNALMLYWLGAILANTVAFSLGVINVVKTARKIDQALESGEGLGAQVFAMSMAGPLLLISATLFIFVFVLVIQVWRRRDA